jgi:hypothetical protein
MDPLQTIRHKIANNLRKIRTEKNREELKELKRTKKTSTNMDRSE